MDLRRLPIGEMAGPDADCITVYRQTDGHFRLEGAALADEESVAMLGEEPYASQQDAESAGMAWADDLGVTMLHIATIEE